MINSGAVQIINVQLDIQEAQNSANTLAETLETMARSLETIAQWDMSSIASDMAQMEVNLYTISMLLSEKLDSGSWLSTFSEITSSGEALLGIFTTIAGKETLREFFDGLGQELVTLGSIPIDWSSILGGLSVAQITAIIVALILLVTVITKNFDLIKARFSEIWDNHLKPLWDNFSAAMASIGENLMSIWNGLLQPIFDWIISIFEPIILTAIYTILGEVEGAISFFSSYIGGIISVLDGIIQFITGVFAGDWEKAWEGVTKAAEGWFEVMGAALKGVVNGFIRLCNIILGALYSMIANVINTIGGYVTAIGNLVGQDWGFSVPTNPPQIPYLAKGAVLPANRPFLAMVGDQKHGTNIEAPLATIQEAVAIVMEDMIASNMAGHEATVGVLREILSAVLGIHIGDDVIGQAVARYNSKMAVMRGGYV